MATQSLPQATPKKLHLSLWGVQVLLALAFGMAGASHLASSPEALIQQGMAWAGGAPPALVKFIGAAELLGAIGLILPAATRIQPRLTAWAGVGLATIMALAALTHLARGEAMVVPVNLALGGLAAFVAWGRFRGAPQAPRA